MKKLAKDNTAAMTKQKADYEDKIKSLEAAVANAAKS